MGYLTIEVGKPSPFERPEQGSTVLALRVTGNGLLLVVQWPTVSTADVAIISGQAFALSLYQDTGHPIGIMHLALSADGESVEPLEAPILGDLNEMKALADQALESNILLVVLVDPVSNTVKTVRTIGLPLEFLEFVRAGIRATTNISWSIVIDHASRLAPQEVWSCGEKWLVGPDSEWVKK